MFDRPGDAALPVAVTMEITMLKSIKETIATALSHAVRGTAATGGVLALVCGVTPALADPPVYTLTQVPLPPGAKIFFGGGGGVNNAGDIAFTTFSSGRFNTGNQGDATPPRGFVWQFATGRNVELGTLGGTASSAFAINDCAEVVGSSSLKGDKVTHAALFRAGTVVDLDPRGALADGPRLQSSFAASINNAGAIVGSVFFPKDNDYHPVSFQGGTVKDLTGKIGQAVGINLSGEIAGSTASSSGSGPPGQGFVIKNGQLTTFTPDATSNAMAFAINDFGDVAGTVVLNSLSSNSYLFQDGQLSIPPSNDPMTGNQIPQAIDNSGNFVGENFFPTPPFTLSAFLVRGPTEYFLDQLVDPKDSLAPFVSLNRAFGINDSGWIAAEGTDSRDGGLQLHIYLLKRTSPAIQVKRVTAGCSAPK